MKFDLGEVLGIPELPIYLKEVEKSLAQHVAIDNARLQQPIARIIARPGKFIRAALVVSAASTEGGSINTKVIDSAVAIELIHLASLVHDDIMDNATSRHKVETIHKKEGLNTAILVGDFLFAKANLVATSVSPELAKLVAETICNLCDGQAKEFADAYNSERTEAAYTETIRLKTASLISASCKAGALAGNLNKTQVDEVALYGESFGMALQIIDDVLDIVSTPELLGKPTGTDIREGIYTLPVILALKDKNNEEVLNQTNPRKVLKSYIGSSIEEIKRYNSKAVKVFANSNDHSLGSLPNTYLEWALANLVAK